MNMKKFVLVLFLLASLGTVSFAGEKENKLDFGLGLSYGPMYHLPKIDFEFKKNSFDFQFGVTGFGVPYLFENPDDISPSPTAIVPKAGTYCSLRLCTYFDGGYIWMPWENLGHAFGAGVDVTFMYTGLIGSRSKELFLESFRLYFKYSYTFKSGWEIGAKTFLPVIGIHQQKYDYNWDVGVYWLGSFYEAYPAIFNAFIPTLEVKYYFRNGLSGKNELPSSCENFCPAVPNYL